GRREPWGSLCCPHRCRIAPLPAGPASRPPVQHSTCPRSWGRKNLAYTTWAVQAQIALHCLHW
ncbi:hypothetical protein ACJX0J_033127, partial [Zea mays]